MRLVVGPRALLHALRGALVRRFGSSASAGPGAWEVLVPYQRPPADGGRVGRYIGRPDAGDLADEQVMVAHQVADARGRVASPTMGLMGFELRRWPTDVEDFGDDDAVKAGYYPEVRELVRAATGAEAVVVFDHTVRSTASDGGSLNALGARGATAATVGRVHSDYTPESARRRFEQLRQGAEWNELSTRPYAFVNVWRSVADEPVQKRPLALLDPRSVHEEDTIRYAMRFPEREGENFALKHNPTHEWYFYPRMTKDECLLFTGFDTRRPGLASTVFHTAIDDPTSNPNAPDRRSIECRCIALFPEKRKPLFLDMVHSNNAARVRLWIQLKGLEDVVETRFVAYADMQYEDYPNPLKKVPALVTEDGRHLFESNVILAYLEDKYRGEGRISDFDLGTAEERAHVALLIRVHDLYIASPNCTQPNFAHTQGAMYLGPVQDQFTPERRTMDTQTRAAKIAEIWKQLNWLEQNIKGPFLAGNAVSLADFTWFPTLTFMEFMLPRVFGWTDITHDAINFKKIGAWYAHVQASYPAFAACRNAIFGHWEKMEAAGQFVAIVDEVASSDFKWRYP